MLKGAITARRNIHKIMRRNGLFPARPRGVGRHRRVRGHRPIPRGVRALAEMARYVEGRHARPEQSVLRRLRRLVCAAGHPRLGCT